MELLFCYVSITSLTNIPGVGISGVEGNQALMASDYTVAQFKYPIYLICLIKNSTCIYLFDFQYVLVPLAYGPRKMGLH